MMAATPMAVQPVLGAALQNPGLRAPGVPRDRAQGELALDDGPEGDRRRRGAGECEHLARGTVPRAARLRQPRSGQRRRVAIASAVLPRAARDVEPTGAVPRVQVPRVGGWRRANVVKAAADRAQVRPAASSGGGVPVPIVLATVVRSVRTADRDTGGPTSPF